MTGKSASHYGHLPHSPSLAAWGVSIFRYFGVPECGKLDNAQIPAGRVSITWPLIANGPLSTRLLPTPPAPASGPEQEARKSVPMNPSKGNARGEIGGESVIETGI